ncbi:MAG: hypothetical protein AAB588_03595 [Patescibacteria group bacterium]
MQNTKSLLLDDDVKQELVELQEKGVNINELLRGFLEKRKMEIAQEKERLVADGAVENSARYIPVAIKEILKKEHGDKCSINHCTKKSQTIHHTQRFALSRSHDPHFLAPLCQEHHAIAHSIDVKASEMRLSGGSP